MIDVCLVRRLYREQLPIRYIARLVNMNVDQAAAICGHTLDLAEDLYDRLEDLQMRGEDIR